MGKSIRFLMSEIIELENKMIAQAKKLKMPVDFLALAN